VKLTIRLKVEAAVALLIGTTAIIVWIKTGSVPFLRPDTAWHGFKFSTAKAAFLSFPIFLSMFFTVLVIFIGLLEGILVVRKRLLKSEGTKK